MLVAGDKQGKLLNDWYNETAAASRFFQSTLVYLSSGALTLALIVLGLVVNWQAMLGLLAGGGVVVLFAGRRMYGSATQLSQVKLQTSQAIVAAMAENSRTPANSKLMRQRRYGLASWLNCVISSERYCCAAQWPRIYLVFPGSSCPYSRSWGLSWLV